jgi:hypothetical protein
MAARSGPQVLRSRLPAAVAPKFAESLERRAQQPLAAMKASQLVARPSNARVAKGLLQAGPAAQEP